MQVVLNDPEAVQSEVDRVNDALTKAIEGLESTSVVKSGDTTSVATGDDTNLTAVLGTAVSLSAIAYLFRKKK